MRVAGKLKQWLGGRAPAPMAAAYARLVEEARTPAWYVEGGVPDTVDGRFDVVALVVSLAVIRLQQSGRAQAEADLIDRFADDMDASFRELGVGDLSISKTVGHAVSALGGRLSAYRAALSGDGALDAALVRNLYRGHDPGPVMLAAAAARTREIAARFGGLSAEVLEGGAW